MYDVIIIGGGPAGLSAAIYSGRRSLKTLVLTKDLGGQASKTSDIENYPGIINTSGTEMAKIFQTQAKNFEAEIKYEEVKKIAKNNDVFAVKTLNNQYEAKTIILASGKKPRELGVPGEDKFKGRGVSYCATCDAPFFKDKTVIIVGGGNSALHAALLSAKVAKKVIILQDLPRFTGEQLLIDQINNGPNIETHFSTEIAEINGETKVKSVTTKDGKEIKTDGIIIEIGYIVDAAVFKNLVKINELNEIITDKGLTTSEAGIFAAGDLTDNPYKQIVISAGEGARAALSAYDYIQKGNS